MTVHRLYVTGMFLVQSGRAIQGLLSKGLLTVRMDCGPVSCLPSRLPPADLGTFDVVDANNKGDTVTTTIMLIVASQLLRAGSGLVRRACCCPRGFFCVWVCGWVCHAGWVTFSPD